MNFNSPKTYQPTEREPNEEETNRILADTDLIKAETRLRIAQAEKAEEEARSSKLRFQREELELKRQQSYTSESLLRTERLEHDDKLKRVGVGHNGVFFFDKEVRGDYGGLSSDLRLGIDFELNSVDAFTDLIPESFQPLAAKMAESFFGPKSDTVLPVISQLTVWSEKNPGEPIELVINSPGGSVYAGWRLFGTLRNLSKKGHHITTVISGMAASMGGVIAQAGDTRVIEEHSSLMIHEASSGAWGPAHTIRDQADHLTAIGKKIRDIYLAKSDGKTTAPYFDRKWHRKDWWLFSEEALERGFVDEVR